MAGLTDVLDLTRPELWIAGSVGLTLIATNLAWLLQRGLRGRRWWAAIVGSSGFQAAGWLSVSICLLLPPLIAWRAGAISPYLLGLAELDWTQIFGLGGLLTGMIPALIVFGWLVYRHTVCPTGTSAGEGRRLAALRTPINAALGQWRLAFYRAAATAWLAAMPALTAPLAAKLQAGLQAQPLYWGSWLGLGLLLLEWAFNPFTLTQLQPAAPGACVNGRSEAALRALALAVATTALFTLTRNFWLCLACQVIAETAIAGWLPLRTAAAEA